jgi:hypothetical protein
LLIQSSLGLTVDGLAGRVVFTRPALPASLPDLRIFDLEVAGARVDLHLTRHEEDVSVRVMRRKGMLDVLVEQ